MRCMDEDQAQALWDYVGKLPFDVDKHMCWQVIEKIFYEKLTLVRV